MHCERWCVNIIRVFMATAFLLTSTISTPYWHPRLNHPIHSLQVFTNNGGNMAMKVGVAPCRG